MDRLTYFDGGQWLLKKDNVTVRSHDVEELAQEGIDRHAAYEDTGLIPEEIQQAVDLFKDWPDADIPKELKAWVGRCVWHVRKCNDLRKENEDLRNALKQYKDAEAEATLKGDEQDGAD